MNKRKVGSLYEEKAVNYLKGKGMELITCNYRCRLGEIDIIGRHNGFLVFVEVKYRKNNLTEAPEEAVHSRKQRTICKVADYYRMKENISEFSPIRYDILAVCGDEITWYQNGFNHSY